MTYCAFDSLEISTCVRVPFYVTPPHSQPFNMMHICTSTATNPPPRSTPTSAKHTNRHTRRQMRTLGSTHARVLSHRHTRRHHRFVCAYWGCSLHAGKHTCGHIYTHGALTDDLFLFLFFNSFIQTYSYIDPRFMCLKKQKTFPWFVIRPGHMPSQAPHTSLIMQMRGNVTPQQQMARDDNNGWTDQFQCLRLYRYGNNKNRWYEILVC